MTRNSKPLLLLILLIAIFAANSCKKDDQTSISDFLTQSTWNFALLQRFKYVNEALVKTDTLQTGCSLNQTLKFNTDNSYNFNNYGCKTGVISSTWSFTPDMLYLNLNSVISQTSATFSSRQNVARIINLGQYSLSFDAGDVNLVHKPTDTVVIYRYGFIHSK